MLLSSGFLIFMLSISTGVTSAASSAAFTPCPLLGPRFPIPTSIASSTIIQKGLKNVTTALDEYVATSNGDYGPTSPNTTSFSIAFFFSDDTNLDTPFFYEYHHTAPTLKFAPIGVRTINKDSVYRIGDLTTLFTIFVFLIEAGDAHWQDPVSKLVPELAVASSREESLVGVDWDAVTLGDLAAHLGGIGRYAPTLEIFNFNNSSFSSLLPYTLNNTSTLACGTNASSCTSGDFMSYFGKQPAVFSPGTTPSFSNAGFIILATALERITGRSYSSMLEDSVIKPLNMSSTTIIEPSNTTNAAIPANATTAQWSHPVAIEAPYNGLYSTISDISSALRAILSSTLLPKSTTNRWLKPISLTSNLVNSVGRPWEIYSLTSTPISPVIPIYQVRGNVGLYSSHLGLAPDYGTGFVILATDSNRNPDLNAYADIIAAELVPALEQNAIYQASKAFAGIYSNNNTQASLTIAEATDSSPGLSLTEFTAHGQDVRTLYAKANNIEPNNLSFRLYPTNLKEDNAHGGRTVVFRASFQDTTALADAGTPTCDTWRYIDELQIGGIGLDEFVFTLDGEGMAVNVDVPAFQFALQKGKAQS